MTARGRDRAARLTGSERRAQLLDVAAACFARHGYHATTTAMLAREAGITEPILYQHFDDKRALFIELISVTAGRMIDALKELWDAAPSHADRARLLTAMAEPKAEGGTELDAELAMGWRILACAFVAGWAEPDIARTATAAHERLHQTVRALLDQLPEAARPPAITDSDPVAQLLAHAIGRAVITPRLS